VNNSSIPRIFHFVFGLRPQREPFHLAYYLCLASCIQLNRPDRVYFHYHHEPYGRYWDLIKEKLTLEKVEPVEFISRFDYEDKFIQKHLTYAHHADFIRLEKLLEHGGVYADIDTLFLHPYPDSLFDNPCVLGREDPIRCQQTGALKDSLCNALIMAEPDSEFCCRWLDGMKDAFDGSWSNHSTVLPQQISEAHPETIHIEPPRSFYGFMWTSEDLRRLFEECETDLQNMYSIHLWSHLWWSRRRRDFSSFHQGKLRENYIRKVATTYNLAARPFLPTPKKSMISLFIRRC